MVHASPFAWTYARYDVVQRIRVLVMFGTPCSDPIIDHVTTSHPLPSISKVQLVEIYAATRRQDGRSSNEDAYILGRGELPYAALCDGSGAAQGVAKRALRIFQRLMAEASADEVGQFATWSNWTQLLDSAHMGGPQSTFVAVVILGNRAFGACVGDSRLYRLVPEGGVEIMTEEASKFRLGSGKAMPCPIHLPLKAGEVLLLASDGAWTPLGLPALQRVWGRSTSRHFSEFPTLLLEEAGKNGCSDDMTVVAMRQRDVVTFSVNEREVGV